MKDSRLIRLDDARLRVSNPANADVTLFANSDVPIESVAIDELIGAVGVQQTAERLAEHDPASFPTPPALRKVAVTPDFHKGAGIPIGTVMATRSYVVPQAIGNDINCGMRFHTTTLKADQVVGRLDDLETKLRHLFFEGGRNIPMTRIQRDALFREGLAGLLNAVPRSQDEGMWSVFHEHSRDNVLDRVHECACFEAGTTAGLDDFLGPKTGLSRDGQIGSIGGGNHFVEIQRISRILDGSTAHAWGLKEGAVGIMVHSGSLSIGHHFGTRIRDMLRRIHPAKLRHPENGIFILPDSPQLAGEMRAFWDAVGNAANFAFANRMFLGLMAEKAIREVCGQFGCSLLYDAPHNLVWRSRIGDDDVFLHRKGACPARGFDQMENTPFAYYGEPVLVPGSMGASSFILVGRGNPDSLWSASHGAGRALSRGDALHGDPLAFERFMKSFRVVTSVDFRRPDIRMRRDIMDKKLDDIRKEAPYAYKDIGPIVRTLVDAGIAKPVAEVRPLITVKA
jgi:tRNA-splicing ligase RtcB (3'-phosphate/5'-hydroxy nucleic acid ligase)